MVTGNQLEWVCTFLLRPSDAPLPRCCQVVAIRKIKAVFEVAFHVGHNLLSLRVPVAGAERQNIDRSDLEDLCFIHSSNELCFLDNAEVVQPLDIHDANYSIN